MKQVHLQRSRVIPNKTQPDNRDKKKQLSEATTVQDRPKKNKCVIGDSNMRGLATQLKSGVGMCIRNFGYENSSLKGTGPR